MAPASYRLRCALHLVALLPALLPITTWGLSSDRNQPIYIEADKATLDEGEGISIYEGNVQLRQGTLKLKGNRMKAFLHNTQVRKFLLTGSPASFSQRSDDSDNEQHAEAGKIEYLAAEQRLILQDNARIWQENTEEFSSERIVLNLKDNTLNAGGNGSEGRVHITLQPRTGAIKEKETGQ